MANIYIGSADWTAVAAWTALTAYVSTSNGGRGDYVRQLAAPSVGNERVFRCTTSGTSLAAEPSWTLTKNATTTEVAGPVWTECTGQEADQVSGTWKAPHARLANAFAATWGAAGDTFYVSDSHAETQAAAMTLTSPGTAASPCKIICVDNAGTIPPVSADLKTTATITTTGAFALTIGGGYNSLVYGISFNAGTGATNVQCIVGNVVADNYNYFKNCSFNKLGTTAAVGAIQLGSSTVSNRSLVILDTVTVRFGNTGDGIRCFSNVIWINTPSAINAAGSVPTTLFSSGGFGYATLNCYGVDFSSITGTLVAGVQANGSRFRFSDCRLGAAVAITSPDSPSSHMVEIINSDSGTKNYRHERYRYEGTQSIDTGVVRTGGASDGTTPITWKIVTTANAKPTLPFESFPISIWNETTGSSITVTIYGVWAGGAVPNNNDIWAVAEYLGSGSYPVSSLLSCGLADVLATAAGQTSDGSTWASDPGTEFKLVMTFTPQMKGPIGIRIYAGAASSTFYLDPEPEISGVTVSKSMILAPGVYVNEVGGGGGGGLRLAGRGGLAG